MRHGFHTTASALDRRFRTVAHLLGTRGHNDHILVYSLEIAYQDPQCWSRLLDTLGVVAIPLFGLLLVGINPEDDGEDQWTGLAGIFIPITLLLLPLVGISACINLEMLVYKLRGEEGLRYRSPALDRAEEILAHIDGLFGFHLEVDMKHKNRGHSNVRKYHADFVARIDKLQEPEKRRGLVWSIPQDHLNLIFFAGLCQYVPE